MVASPASHQFVEELGRVFVSSTLATTRSRQKEGSMKRMLIALAISTLGAGGILAAAGPALAGGVSCVSQGFSTANGGNAWANGCSHSGDHQVRLYGECDWTPFVAYSPWKHGSFQNYDFTTSGCTFGVNASGFDH
jgi:hypothetical protein